MFGTEFEMWIWNEIETSVWEMMRVEMLNKNIEEMCCDIDWIECNERRLLIDWSWMKKIWKQKNWKAKMYHSVHGGFIMISKFGLLHFFYYISHSVFSAPRHHSSMNRTPFFMSPNPIHPWPFFSFQSPHTPDSIFSVRAQTSNERLTPPAGRAWLWLGTHILEGI